MTEFSGQSISVLWCWSWMSCDCQPVGEPCSPYCRRTDERLREMLEMIFVALEIHGLILGSIRSAWTLEKEEQSKWWLEEFMSRFWIIPFSASAICCNFSHEWFPVLSWGNQTRLVLVWHPIFHWSMIISEGGHCRHFDSRYIQFKTVQKGRRGKHHLST